MEDILPPHIKTYRIEEIYKHLENYHGIASQVASNRLHKIKDDKRLPADFKLLFDRTGNIYRVDDRTHIGSLTSGGRSLGET